MSVLVESKMPFHYMLQRKKSDMLMSDQLRNKMLIL